MPTTVVYLAEIETRRFQEDRLSIKVVCAGDSITGWNNYGSLKHWPYRTYPEFLQERCEALELRIANGGIAGEISQNGIGQVRDYLNLFPMARYFVVGYGTNDLGMWPEMEDTTRRVIENLNQMVRTIRERGRKPILLNVPYASESLFPQPIAQELHEQRDHHNGWLKEYCGKNQVPLADICSVLRDEHFADELHPNDLGARAIAEQVHWVLTSLLATD